MESSTPTSITTEEINEFYNTNPIRIDDAASMLRRKLNKNERPYIRAVIEKNNSLVDEWYSRVLMRIADKKSTVPAGRVFPSWTIFLEGKEILNRQQHTQFFPVVTPEAIQHWINFFLHTNIEGMHMGGSGLVALGWQVLTGAMREHFAREKWEKIYSLSDDPYVWEKEAAKYPQLLKGQPMPFGMDEDQFKDAAQKVQAILNTRIEPEN